ncbi:D-sedoheptulose-7-phosphate isomerase [Aquitalea magnusonii]|uniref:Phosphoheptose isomerase n=1 Tax=Aquitalea magnusonii TaxID=332411 RepID=A0A318JV40_9NEIS|nr:SIS domain-containing protein [Aquitalea magnusonii]PXX44370.1 phosphoheptose isomerase [Aquitalea magnusonii]
MLTDNFLIYSQQFQGILAQAQATDGNNIPMSIEHSLQRTKEVLLSVRAEGKDVYLLGNGGSAALVAHVQTDLVNKCRLRAHVLQEPSLLTCMSNDYGYANAYQELISRYIRSGDVVLAVSSSGQSANILQACDSALANEANIITLSGFSANNHLRSKGMINIWLPSDDYGMVEVGHQLILHYLSDSLAEN